MDRKALDRVVYAVVWLACLAPLLWLAWRGFNTDLGANPIDRLIRELGVWGLRLLIVGLAITPLARILKQPRLIRFRRTIGLFAFTYVLLHLTNYVVTDQWFDWAAIGKDILKRPFITVGFAAFLLMIPLALTSTDAMVRRLGRRWGKLHRLVYAVAIAAILHYWWHKAGKNDFSEVGWYAAVVIGLLGWRLVDRRRRRAAPHSPV